MSNIENNKELIEKYPFLLPRNVWTGKVSEDYDYSYTLLDDMPEGWKNCFGEIMCEIIKDALVKNNYLEKYRISQIKEKYGFEAKAIVTMAEVVDHLYNKPYKETIVIDDNIKTALDEYYKQYGIKAE